MESRAYGTECKIIPHSRLCDESAKKGCVENALYTPVSGRRGRNPYLYDSANLIASIPTTLTGIQIQPVKNMGAWGRVSPFISAVSKPVAFRLTLPVSPAKNFD